jgi:folate-dependent phosphoribosylglycinamide formyltransferase PurN
MGIVLFTVPGEAQMRFANSLYKQTGGGLSLVIVQKTKKKSLLQRIYRFFWHNGWRTFSEFWYAFLLRKEHQVERALGYFREIDPMDISENSSKFKILEVESANTDAVHEIIRKISPRLIVVWGGPLLKPNIIKNAQKAINLHFGLCPHYRGALANQHAVMRDDFSKIGASVLFINGQPDAGEILATVEADISKSPRELFRDLNNRAAAKYLEIATKIYLGKHVPTVSQEAVKNEILLRKSWTPKTRYMLGKKILEWEKKFEN